VTVGRTKGLIIRAFRPAANLAHDSRADLLREPDHVAAVDALTALGRIKEPAGAAVLHARLGGEDAELVKAVLLDWATTQFAVLGWTVPERPRIARAATMAAFVDQVWREFLGKPCARCDGRGFRGQKFGAVQHGLEPCSACGAAGFVWAVTRRTKTKVRRQCSVCRGKRYVQIAALEQAGKLRACSSCDGSGVVKHTLRVRARALRMRNVIVARVWGPRFTLVLAELKRIERAALFSCDNYLFGP